MAIQEQDEMMAFLANDLYNKRQRLIRASRPNIDVFDDRTVQALEEEYQVAESEYAKAKAAFARAMRADKRAA